MFFSFSVVVFFVSPYVTHALLHLVLVLFLLFLRHLFFASYNLNSNDNLSDIPLLTRFIKQNMLFDI